jgi:hypothetical protein
MKKLESSVFDNGRKTCCVLGMMCVKDWGCISSYLNKP